MKYEKHPYLSSILSFQRE